MPDRPETKLLVNAAPKIAERLKLEQLTPELVALAAGVSLDAFKLSFTGIEHYMDAVHLHFMESILRRQLAELGHMPASMERIHLGTNLQLDICLEQRALRSLVAEARRRLPRVIETLRRRNHSTSLMISLELKNLGCAQSMSIARLYTMMVLEAADIEADAGRPVPEVRSALRDFLAHRVVAAQQQAVSTA